MTQNLYLGTDLAPVLSATTVPGLIAAATAGFAHVQATNFAERAVALAKEVETARPTLIALQEVSLFRIRAASAPSPATTVAIDYLQLLLDALAARGLQYGVVAEVKNFDSEIPAFLPGITGLGFVRLTDRDVILARTDLNRGHLFLSNVQSSNFATNLTVPAAVGSLTLLRGWASVDVTVRGKMFRFLTTHLEPFYPPVQVAQANELLAGPGNTNLPLVFAGDFNTDAGALPTEPTYGNLIAAGFVDAWSQIDPLDPGYTCCEAADLLNATPSLDTRIDLVLLRDGFGRGNRSIAADAAEVVGGEPEDKTPSGLWPSDHAGVVVKFHLGNSGEDPE
ncbi:MAG TPA: endonuclease/exonuclease/phosphatase family protein [Candidatus Methylomirabilis sp.]|nr:endonuclease/exonuclease/phosphatase family protein [Candidatus Methylomirabilis sp.]